MSVLYCCCSVLCKPHNLNSTFFTVVMQSGTLYNTRPKWYNIWCRSVQNTFLWGGLVCACLNYLILKNWILCLSCEACVYTAHTSKLHSFLTLSDHFKLILNHCFGFSIKKENTSSLNKVKIFFSFWLINYWHQLCSHKILTYGGLLLAAGSFKFIFS